jgi:hypothetical protein
VLGVTTSLLATTSAASLNSRRPSQRTPARAGCRAPPRSRHRAEPRSFRSPPGRRPGKRTIHHPPGSSSISLLRPARQAIPAEQTRRIPTPQPRPPPAPPGWSECSTTPPIKASHGAVLAAFRAGHTVRFSLPRHLLEAQVADAGRGMSVACAGVVISVAASARNVSMSIVMARAASCRASCVW